jgi:37-kD nucleoid-associated bacterial protein
MKLNTFKISEVVIHDVPRGNDDEEELVLTDGALRLDEPLRRYFQKKIVDSLSQRGIEVVADVGEDDGVRKCVAQILQKRSALVSASQAIAERLNEVQSAKNPAGLLVVAVGFVDGQPCVSVLKLEREQGVRFRIDTIRNRRVIDLEYLRDLTLTDKTKVFKTSLLVMSGRKQEPAANITGRVSDDQRGSETGGVATFFLGTFLGCRLRDNPEKTTLAFVTATDAFINDDVTDPERRGRYQVALLATMQDQTTEVRARTFARANIDSNDRARYLDRVREAGVDPDAPFPKDNRLVKVNGFKMTFESGMVLVGSRHDLDERVTIRPQASNDRGVVVDDTIKTLGGR